MLSLSFQKALLFAVFYKIIVPAQSFKSCKRKSIQLITVLPGQVQVVQERVLKITTDLNKGILKILLGKGGVRKIKMEI